MNPWLRTSSSSPRIEMTSWPSVSILSPHVASQNGHVRKWTAIVSWSLLPQLDPERPRRRERLPFGIEQGHAGVALATVDLDRPGDERVRPLGVDGAVERRREPCQHDRRPFAEVGDRGAGWTVERAPNALGPNEAVVPGERGDRGPARGEQVTVADTAGEDAEAVTGPALRPADHTAGKGVARGPAVVARSR